MNLLNETIEKLKKYNKKIEDIKWVGSNKHYIDIEDFKKLANKNYDSSYGCMEVATNLLIVGEDWWLERHDYDGSEWWEYKKIPKKPEKKLKPKRIISNNLGYETLEEMNGEEYEYK